MSKHPCIPITLTVNNRAQWIKDNSIEVIQHAEKTELDDEQVHELESKSSLASRSLDRLEEVKKLFLDYLKNGTPVIEFEPQPIDITIPPTKGQKILKANRAFADKQLEQGFSEENVEIYIIPYPEESLMVALDIEGNEWPDFTKEMTTDEINQHKPMLRKKEKTGHHGSALIKKSQTEIDLVDESGEETMPELDL